MIEVGNAFSGILDAHKDVVYPSFRVAPASYKLVLVHLKVIYGVAYFASKIDQNPNATAIQPSQPEPRPSTSLPVQGTPSFGSNSSLGMAESFRTP